MMKSILRKRGLGICLLVVVSLVTHLGYLYSPLATRNFLPMDEALYWDLADHLTHEGRLALSGPAFATAGAEERTLFWTPVYPCLLSLIQKSLIQKSLIQKASLTQRSGLVSKTSSFLKLEISPSRLLQLLQILLVACVPFLMYPIAARFLRGKPLWCFLLFSSLYPYTFQLATQAGSETTALFLSLAVLSLVFLPAWKSPPSLFLIGTLAAWLCLDRPEYLIFSAVLLAWVSVRLLRPDLPVRGDRAEAGNGDAGGGSTRLSYRAVAFRLAILSLSFAVWMGAWMYRNYQVTDRIVFTTRSGYSLAYQNEYYHLYSRGEVDGEEEWRRGFPSFPTEMERYAYLKNRARGFILGHPLVYAQLCAKRLASFFLPQEVKTLIYRLMGKRDIKVEGLPGWFRFSNLIFLGGLWFLAFPALLRILYRLLSRRGLGRRGLRLSTWESPAGLILLLVLGQIAVYTFFAYIEYQRSILDLEILLLGCILMTRAQLDPQKLQKSG